MQKIVMDSTSSGVRTDTTWYISGFIFRDDTLQYFSHPEGRVRWVAAPGTQGSFVYDYFLEDHLGNNQMVLTEESDTAGYYATMEVKYDSVEN